MSEVQATYEIHVAEDTAEWFIVELMGHVRLAGKVTADERFGGKLSRIEIPGPKQEDGSETWVTQWFGTGGVYRITSCSEVTARRIAAFSSPSPVHPWEFPKQLDAGRDDEDDREENDAWERG